MSHKHAYGPVIPDAGDDLLKAWSAYVESSTHIIPVGSVAEANAMLTSLKAAGVAPTAKRPLYFDINDVVYKCIGYQKSDGSWLLNAINWTNCFTRTATQQQFNFGRTPGSHETVSLAAGRWHRLMHVPIEPSKAPRQYLVIGTAWTSSQTGEMNLEVYERPTDGAERGSKTRIITSDDSSTTVIKSGYLPAGEQMDFTLYVRAETYNAAKVTVYYDDWTRLYVQLTPANI